MSKGPESAPLLVACVDSSEDVAQLLAEYLRLEDFRAISYVTPTRFGPESLIKFVTDLRPDACIYTIAIPYEQSWRESEALRAAVPDVAFVLTTINKRALAEIVGPAGGEALEVIGEPFDLDLICAAVRRAVVSTGRRRRSPIRGVRRGGNRAMVRGGGRRMRWSEMWGGLPPDQATQMLNGLTVGLGMLALAARRAVREQPVAAVERAAAAAHDALAHALALLPDPPPATDDPLRVPAAAAMPDLAWPVYLAGRLDGDGATLRKLLMESVTLARQAGDAMVHDGDGDAVVGDADAARATLAAFLDRLSGPPRR